MEKLIGAVVLGVIALGGGWVYARYDLSARVVQLDQKIRGIGLERGGRLPSPEKVTTQVEAFAAELGLTVEALEVDIEGIDDDTLDRADATTRKMAGQMAKAGGRTRIKREVKDYKKAGLAVETYKISHEPDTVQGNLIELRGTIRGKQWFWSIAEPLKATLTLRSQ